ncbi:MAG TPA: hypothetical protein DIW46_04975 [Microbacterium sp.]|nr:hypothetical protein [Microbacterium sp.]
MRPSSTEAATAVSTTGPEGSGSVGSVGSGSGSVGSGSGSVGSVGSGGKTASHCPSEIDTTERA